MILPLLFLALMAWIFMAGRFSMLGYTSIAAWLWVTTGVFVPAFAVACYYY
jgi:hypothetical protein